MAALNSAETCHDDDLSNAICEGSLCGRASGMMSDACEYISAKARALLTSRSSRLSYRKSVPYMEG